jgi:uncharacterized protein with gpF-like domain
VIAEGGTFEQWKSRVVPDLQNAIDSGTAPGNIITERRLRTIYDTNLRMARAAGQWKRIEALKPYQPFLMYSAVRDTRTRPLHRKWGGIDPALNASYCRSIIRHGVSFTRQMVGDVVAM